MIWDAVVLGGGCSGLSAATALAEKQYKGLLELYERFLRDPNSPKAEQDKVTSLTQFVVAGLDGILVQELAYPDEKRSKGSIDCLVVAAQTIARSAKSNR